MNEVEIIEKCKMQAVRVLKIESVRRMWGETLEEVQNHMIKYYTSHPDEMMEDFTCFNGHFGFDTDTEDSSKKEVIEKSSVREMKLSSMKGKEKTFVLEDNHLQGEKKSYSGYKYNPLSPETAKKKVLLELTYLVTILQKNSICLYTLTPKTQRELISFLLDIPKRKISLGKRAPAPTAPRYLGFNPKVSSYANFLVLMQIQLKDEMLDKMLIMIPRMEEKRKRKERAHLTERENNGEPLLT